MKATDFARDSVGDPNFIRHLRMGRSPSLLTADRVCAFMEMVRQNRQVSGKRTKLPSLIVLRITPIRSTSPGAGTSARARWNAGGGSTRGRATSRSADGSSIGWRMWRPSKMRSPISPKQWGRSDASPRTLPASAADRRGRNARLVPGGKPR
jgi:hypothetical protein